MKNLLLLSIAMVFTFTVVAPITAEAGCSYNGYINSGGKCAKSWEKKEKKHERYYDEDRYDDDDDRDDDRRRYTSRISSEQDLEEYIEYLLDLIEELRDLQDGNDATADEEPDVTTNTATSIGDDEARLRGRVDMNDFRNGTAFFVYGEDEDAVDDATDEDRYSDIDEDGDNLQKVVVDSDVDSTQTLEKRVTGLDNNTRQYFALCVEYEDEDDDDALECGTVREFRTDN